MQNFKPTINLVCFCFYLYLFFITVKQHLSEGGVGYNFSYINLM